MNEIKLGIKRLNSLRELVERTLYDTSVNENNKYSSCVMFVDNYNRIIEDIFNTVGGKIKLSTISLRKRNPYDMLCSQQKTLMETTLSAINDSVAILENEFIKNENDAKNQNDNFPNKLFISHSSKDGKYVEAIVKLLEGLGFDESNLFCSYLSPYNIPTGEDIYDYLYKQFSEYNLHMLFVLSQNYYKSVACQNEVGAAWLLRSNETILFTPNFDFHKMEGALSNTLMGIKLEDTRECNERLNDFKNRMIKEFGLSGINENVWERNRNDFIREVVNISDETANAETEDIHSNSNSDKSNVLEYKFISNDDRFIAYYINKTKKIKFNVSEVFALKNSGEYKNIDINNGIEIMKKYGILAADSTDCKMTVTNDAFINLCDDNYIKSKGIDKTVEYLYAPASKKFKCYLKNDWKLEDYIILFFKFVCDTFTDSFWIRLAKDTTIKAIIEWEESNFIERIVSSNYDKIIDFLIKNEFVYDVEWTDFGDPLRYRLCNSIVGCLNSKKFNAISKISYERNSIFK